MATEASCPKCQGKMERGFLSDVSWWRGDPSEARDTKAFSGPKLRTEVYEALAFRCSDCGHLETRTGGQIAKPGDALLPG